MYDGVLLPTDGNDSIAAAARHVGTLADRFDATVHVLSVVDTRNRFEGPTGGLSMDAWIDAERDRAEHAVEDAVALLRDDLSIETAVVEGVPTTTILDYVEAGDVLATGAYPVESFSLPLHRSDPDEAATRSPSIASETSARASPAARIAISLSVRASNSTRGGHDDVLPPLSPL